MKQYQCYKKVWAGKIASTVLSMSPADYGLILDDGEIIHQTLAWATKHEPKVGGYYVQYEDGYTSYSPAAAFESGYKEITA